MEGNTIGAIPEIRFSTVAYDTRNIVDGSRSVFFALTGAFRDGHAFIGQAYEKGVRCFIVSGEVNVNDYPEAGFIQVPDTLMALQTMAMEHRRKFSYTVIAITGSAGKTTVKEWLYHLISPDLRVIRSPKSYNSQLGVALSLHRKSILSAFKLLRGLPLKLLLPFLINLSHCYAVPSNVHNN